MRHTLSCHPDFPSDVITGVDVEIDFVPAGTFILRYNVIGAVECLELPEATIPERADGLWKETCFEAFIGKKDAPEYLELNLSPSSRWAVYAFDGYREGMRSPDLEHRPRVEIVSTANRFELTGRVNLGGIPLLEADSLEIALTAVIAEKSGRKSLWALDHPSGSPDFHSRDCFLYNLKVAKSR